MFKDDFGSIVDNLMGIIVSNIKINSNPENDEIISIIENEIFSNKISIDKTFEQKKELAEEIFNIMKGYDILQKLIEDNSITEIMCNGHESIFIERNGVIEKTNYRFSNKFRYLNLIQKIASDVNRKVDFSNPIVDARIKDGSRVNIVLDPVAINGPIMTIRKFNNVVLSIDDLISFNSFSSECGEFLKKIIKKKVNIFISGGTGSGKTTLLNALCKEINWDERVITIEDSAEIVIDGIENYVSLEKRNRNVEGMGEIDISDLIRTSLRMRPDRIIVGEIRGGEALDMLQAMNTGHDGSISTGHSNSAIDMVSRIETMVISNFDIPSNSIKRQISSAIDVIVHLSRMRNGSRRIIEILQIRGFRNNEIEFSKLFSYDYEKDDLIKVGEFNDRRL